MQRLKNFILFLLLTMPVLAVAQINEAYDDFEGNSNIPTWAEDDCLMNTEFANPFVQGINTSATVLRYQDVGGQYANVRFQMDDNFDLSENQTFSLKIYVPSDGITGNQPNQVSLKLQDGTLPQPWVTQSEIIKSIEPDQWQTVTFDFEHDSFINLNGGSLPPTLRTDFNRVVIQVNGENNNDEVLAFIDDIFLYATEDDDPVFGQLIWSDEFDTDGPLDPVKWHHQTELPNGTSWYNGEIQHYTDRTDNSYVEDGVLRIVAKRENYTDQGVTKNFTSARLNSKFAFTYGKVEIRAKLPTGAGTWPALWMLGKNISEPGAYWETLGYGTSGWPECGEVDIMEHWGTNQDHVSSAIHTPSSYGGTVNVGGRTIPGVSDEFHVYAMEWTEEKMTFSVDDIVHYIYNPAVKNDDTWPFDLEQYLIFNVAILPSITADFSESAMEIDYVRIYQQGQVSTGEPDQAGPQLVFPNPFQDEISILVRNTSEKTADVKLYSSNGLRVKHIQTAVNNGRIVLRSLSDLANGVYFVHLTLGERTFIKKIIKE